MVDPVTARLWLFRLAFVGLAMLFLFVRLLPLTTEPTQWPGPDLLLCVTIAWVVRRPDYLPVLVIAAVYLLEDLMLMRPPGLWTLLAVMVSEFLRNRAPLIRDMPFLVEWAMFAGVIVTMMTLNRVVLAVVFVPQPGLALTALQALMSMLVYPLVVLFLQSVLRLNKLAPGDIDALGHRL